MQPNLDVARAFLQALDPAAAFTFQTFDDSEAKRGSLARIIHGHFDAAVRELTALNLQGAGIFVTVNRTDGKGRKSENIVAIRALFVDADDVPLPATWHANPDLICSRGEQRWHAYWLLRAGESLKAFEGAQKRLAQHYGTDPKVCDLPRVMRVPGFWHRKGEPIMVEFQDCR